MGGSSDKAQKACLIRSPNLSDKDRFVILLLAFEVGLLLSQHTGWIRFASTIGCDDPDPARRLHKEATAMAGNWQAVHEHRGQVARLLPAAVACQRPNHRMVGTLATDFAYANGKIKLTKRDGSTIEVPLENMSQSDRGWIKKTSGSSTAAKRPAQVRSTYEFDRLLSLDEKGYRKRRTEIQRLLRDACRDTLNQICANAKCEKLRRTVRAIIGKRDRDLRLSATSGMSITPLRPIGRKKPGSHASDRHS